MSTTAEQIVNAPYYTINGLMLSNDATTPNNIVDVSAGICRDSTNQFDINLGNFNGANPNVTANTASTVNITVAGVNGLDTGTVAASTFYAVYVIADNLGRPQYQPALLLSKSASSPLLPAGYGLWKRIGWVLTDGSSHILKFYQQAGNNFTRRMQYDAPIAITVTSSGTSTSYSAMDLSVAMPLTNFGKATIYFAWTSNAAADTVKFQPTGATGDYLTNSGIVAAVKQDASFDILPLIATAKPEISYKNSTASATLNTVLLMAYEDLLT